MWSTTSSTAYDLANMAVGLLGMAFKAESDDTRASLSYKFKKVLSGHVRTVLDHRSLRHHRSGTACRSTTVIAQSDLLILCAPHAAYRDADFKGKPVFDVWGHLVGANVIR